MTQNFGPTDSGPGANLGQDFFVTVLGPMLRGGDGVNGNPLTSNALQAYGNGSGRTVFIKPGTALIRGDGFRSTDADASLNLAINNSGSTRIDRIVVRHDPSLGNDASGQGHFAVIQGTPNAGTPALIRVAGGVWDIPIAQVTCPTGFTNIGVGDVADDRQWLPQVIPFIDTRRSSLPADGSQGLLMFDGNPTRFGLYVTDGQSWQRVITNDDTGWLPVDTSSPTIDAAFTAVYAGVRKRAGWVEVIYEGSWTLGHRYPAFSQSVGGRVAILPPGMRPNRSRWWDAPNSADPNTGPVHINVLPDGTVTLYNVTSDGSGTLASFGFFADN